MPVSSEVAGCLDRLPVQRGGGRGSLRVAHFQLPSRSSRTRVLDWVWEGGECALVGRGGERGAAAYYRGRGAHAAVYVEAVG